jgi:3-oxoacyl-[acyl-carrier protein] reductase
MGESESLRSARRRRLECRRFDKQACLVTGGAGALGVGVCRALAEAGADVCLVDLDASRAEDAARAMQADGLMVAAMACDITDADAVRSLTDEILKSRGKVDVAVNMAGVVRNALLAKVTEEDFDLTMNSHVKGTLNVMQAVAPSMKAQAYGRIVNTSSIAVRGSIAGISYGAAKGAVEAMSKSSAIELARYGITVNCVAPGIIDAGMFLSVPDDLRERLMSRTPMRRPGRVEEVAACIEFLASADASFVTGQTLCVCGGLSVGAMN